MTMQAAIGNRRIIQAVCVALSLTLTATSVHAQLNRQNQRGGAGQQPSQKGGQAPASVPAPSGEAVIKRTIVNPSDPIAIINGEPITRQQLADECVARRGEEILESLIARRLIDQALKAQKLEVTAREIEEEIDRVAMTLAGVSREEWLRSLAKDRNISPAQYARDIIYPALALRKLAEPRVEITDQDLKDAFESEFGEKLVYRMIVTNNLAHANAMFNELQKNPGGFENMARDDVRSIDQATKPSGGKPMQPMARHSYPREATDKIFQQLVDGDPNDKDPSHKPTDGKISGPIQVADGAWILVKREGVVAGRPYDINNPAQTQAMRKAIADSKLQQHMELVMAELVQSAEIENRLKGTIKHANKDIPAPPAEGRTKLTASGETPPSNTPPKADPAVSATRGAAPAPGGSAKPGGVLEEDLKLRQELEKGLGNAAGSAKAAK